MLFPDDIYDFESITVANPGSAGPDDITITAFTAKEKIIQEKKEDSPQETKQ